MPDSNQHIFQKVNARLNISEREQKGGQSERLKDAVQRSVYKLDSVLDKVPGDTMLYIDQIEVQISMSEWNPTLIEEKIGLALAKELRKLIQFGIEKAEPINNINEPINNINKRTLSKKEQYWEILTSFLKSGRVPWWATPQDVARAKDHLDMLSASEWVRFIRSLVRETHLVIMRYVNQWPEKSVLRTIRKVAKEQLGSESIVSLLKGMLAIDAAFRGADDRVYRSEQQIYEIVIRGLVLRENERLIAGHAIGAWLQISGDEPNQQRIKLNELKKYLSRQTSSGSDYSNLLGKEFLPQPLDEISDTSGEEIHQKEDQFGSDNNESIPVRNAGVVLLHSYLPLLFSRLGFTEDGTFRNEETRERAVCAIHYLVTGESEFPEEELVLAKFLCGWSQDEPVNRYLDFSSYEKKECDHLLSNVISHWKALKNTSISGLQTSFLQREGVLKKEEFGYTLFVEELTHDILLQQLPWSYSVVKLSWMSQMLSVQWRTS